MMDNGDPRRRTPLGQLKAPKFVRFHPDDNAAGCDEVFWEDPLTFTPRRGRNGYIDAWGIYPHDSTSGIRDVPGEQIAHRTMRTKKTYKDCHLPMPEMQFVNALIERKVSQLQELDLGDLPKRDYTLYISLPFIEHLSHRRLDRYWRRIRVSGGIPLSVFADKIITPLWGWVRNLHAHVFDDFKDGALFGPKGCNAVDMMHLDKSGYAYIPEEPYSLAHLLQNPGDVMGYHYDFGDNWFVDIKLEEIASLEESTGAVVVLDGAGGIPPDGEQTGPSRWADYLRKARHSTEGKRRAVDALFGATNYAGKKRPADPLAFDFDAFDLEGTRRAVREALDSKASLPYASKQFVSPLGDGLDSSVEALMLRLGLDPRNLKRGTAIVQTPVAGSRYTFLEEGVSETRRDNPGNTACAFCGSPNDLKACGSCGQRYYCGKGCQKAHWREKHKNECKGARRR